MAMDERNPYNQHAQLLLNGSILTCSCGGFIQDGSGSIPKEVAAAGWGVPLEFLPETSATGDSFAEGIEAFASKFGAEIMLLDRLPADAPCMLIEDGAES